MDNKHLEEQAENFVKSQLLKYDFKVTKPSFDKKGGDLIILADIEKKNSKFLLVQSKGRTVLDVNTFVKIPIDYVQNNFILFIYTIDVDNKDCLYCFFPDDIKKWNINKSNYTLTINKKRLKDKYFIEKEFSKKLATNINIVLNQTEIRKYTSVIIDGIFLQKAVDQTIKTYSEIWPDKIFIKPDLNSVIKCILDYYDRNKTETKIVNCYLLLSQAFDFESRININYDSQSFVTKNGNQAKVFINKTNEIISFEVLEQLDRLINNDNIILIADDRIYEDPLNELKKKGIEITVVMLNEHNGGDMFIEFNWGDILYPLGIACGLERHEL